MASVWTLEDVAPQHGRVAVVTGGNGGLGFEVARALGRRGATVVVAARDQDKARSAKAAILAEDPGARVVVHQLDLASLASVRACADTIAGEHGRIDLLVNNAGVMAIPQRVTEDDFEMQLAVNHLGHFVLTRRLLPALLAASAARVVSVTSFARFIGRSPRPANPHLRGRYDPWVAYARSKLANLLFAAELDRRLRRAGASVASLAAHPGLTHSDLQARSVRETHGGLLQRFWLTAARAVGMAPERGAGPLLRAATDPAATGGELYGPRWFTFGPPVRRPLLGRPGQAGARLWALSERETEERFDVEELVRSAA